MWGFNIEGYQGQVMRHPLEDWNLFRDYKFPDPDSGLPAEGSDEITPWNMIYENLDRMKLEGSLIHASLMHGFFFQRLYYLRGFTNLMKDFVLKPSYI